MRYTLTIEPMPDGVPAIVRLRRAMKALLRSHRLRVVDYGELSNEKTRVASAGQSDEELINEKS